MANTDKKTLELISQVKKKKAAIASAEKPVYKTNCSFSYIEGNKNGAINLHVADLKSLINIAAFIIERSAIYSTATKVLGVDNPPDFTWDCYTAEDWIDDLKMKITKIQIVTEKNKLEALEERLNKIISPEKRAEIELEDIANQLGV